MLRSLQKHLSFLCAVQVGEIVNDRYEVFATHGRGVFSSVLRAKDRLRKDAEGGIAEVAIKVIRANETMTKARTLPALRVYLCE